MEKNRYIAYSAAHDFLLSSLNKSGGSAAFYSRIVYPLSKWSASYPETSGYIIPTLFDAGSKTEAVNLAHWITSLQYKDGGLPGGFLKRGVKQEPSVFNTAQMVQGLHRAATETADSRFTESAVRAGRWLADNQEPNGTWRRFNYTEGYSPSYYSRVAWPMLQSAELADDPVIKAAAIKTLDHIQTKVLDNSFIRDSGFKKDSPAFLHTIAYTLRGFLESALLLDRADYWATGYNLAHKLFRQYELTKKLAGAYTETGKRIDWYRCLTGEAQMCIIWMTIAQHDNDPRFLNASSKLIDGLCAAQPSITLIKKKGGLAGSKPFYGRYIALRQPNWASKFFMDAILLEHNSYSKLMAGSKRRLGEI